MTYIMIFSNESGQIYFFFLWFFFFSALDNDMAFILSPDAAFLITFSDIFRGVMMMEIIEALEGNHYGGVMLYSSNQSINQSTVSITHC